MQYTKGDKSVILWPQNWDEARLIGLVARRFIFRGQSNDRWPLQTKIERVFQKRSIELKHLSFVENQSLSDFKSAAHLFTNQDAGAISTLDWISLIQHHGGPTRLLDFTTSFYIAAFFALRDATSDCAIWAIDRSKLKEKMMATLDSIARRFYISSKDVDATLELLIKGVLDEQINEKMVMIVRPSRKCERQFNQHGLFVFPMSLRDGFMASLYGAFDDTSELPDAETRVDIGFDHLDEIIQHSGILKIVLPMSIHVEARSDLVKMNINAAAMFRDMNGLAESLIDGLITIEEYKNSRQTYSILQ